MPSIRVRSEPLCALSPSPNTSLTTLLRITPSGLATNSIELPHDSYVLFNFPGESPDTTKETQDFVESIAGGRGPSSGWVSSQSFFILPGTETYHRMDDYRREFGTEIRHPTWWRETGDHNALATDILPSRAWRDREHELRDFQQWQYAMNLGHLERRPNEVAAFLKGFYGI